MKFLPLVLIAAILSGCQTDPTTALNFKRRDETRTLTPTSAPRYERLGPLPDTMEDIQAALKAPGVGCFATGGGEASSADVGTVYLAAQEPLDVVSIAPGGATVTVNRKTDRMIVIVPRSQVEIGRFAYAKPQ